MRCEGVAKMLSDRNVAIEDVLQADQDERVRFQMAH